MDAWKEWRGGKCPVEGYLFVEYEQRNGHGGVAQAGHLDWKHYTVTSGINIVRYRLYKSEACDIHAPTPLGIGDVRSDAKGSGARYNTGKPDYSLIPLSTLEDEARVWMYGQHKYAAWNWAKGMKWSVPLACLLRHMAAWQSGEELDQESGLPHLAHAMCNLRMLTLYAKTYPEGDDRYKGPKE